MIAIPNMELPKTCYDCDSDFASSFGCEEWWGWVFKEYKEKRSPDCPLIDIVQCKECKHRPIKDDPDGADYGFNIVEPTDGDDVCPCIVEDGWYSWMPEDGFYCGRGERRSE